MRKFFFFAVLVFAAGPPLSAAEVGFLEKSLYLDGETYLYQVFVPADWSAERKWPVVLFLHGAGERGQDGQLQTEVGLGPAIRRNPDFPAVVVFPQCRRQKLWNDTHMDKMVMSALNRTINDYAGDANRVYLTGLSMGGYGVFYFASRYSNRFAALAPVCGGIVPPQRFLERYQLRANDPNEVAAKIGIIPIWLFHGESDPVVSVSESRAAAEAMRSVHDEVRYTEYPGVGHNAWDLAYSEADLIPWLLSKSR